MLISFEKWSSKRLSSQSFFLGGTVSISLSKNVLPDFFSLYISPNSFKIGTRCSGIEKLPLILIESLLVTNIFNDLIFFSLSINLTVILPKTSSTILGIDCEFEISFRLILLELEKLLVYRLSAKLVFFIRFIVSKSKFFLAIFNPKSCTIYSLFNNVYPYEYEIA